MKLAPELERKVLELAGLAQPAVPLHRAEGKAGRSRDHDGHDCGPTVMGIITVAPRRLAIEVDVPVRTVSEANAGGKLRAALGRKAEVKAATLAALPRLADPLPLPAVVTLTRFGVKELDDDNLQRALKSVRDVVAEWLGLPDDRDSRVRFRYRQRPAWVPCVRVRVGVVHCGGPVLDQTR